jgi:hypothetical protein
LEEWKDGKRRRQETEDRRRKTGQRQKSESRKHPGEIEKQIHFTGQAKVRKHEKEQMIKNTKTNRRKDPERGHARFRKAPVRKANSSAPNGARGPALERLEERAKNQPLRQLHFTAAQQDRFIREPLSCRLLKGADEIIDLQLAFPFAVDVDDDLAPVHHDKTIAVP